MPVTLRQAVPGDEDRLLPWMRVFNAGEQIDLEPERVRPHLARLLVEPELGRVWFVEDGGREVGYLVLTFGFDLEFEGRDAFLTEIFLVPEARGRGAGAAVMSALDQEAARLGARAIHLMVRPENTPAVRLYASAGYTEPGRLLLSKRLA